MYRLMMIIFMGGCLDELEYDDSGADDELGGSLHYDSWDTGADTGSDTGSETKGGITAIEIDFDGTQTFISITGGSGVYDEIGLAQTRMKDLGWYGEDCLGGMMGYDICHSAVGSLLTLEVIHTPSEVVKNTTTLLGEANSVYDHQMTLYVLDGSECYVTGHDPSYYEEKGCIEL